MRKLRKDLTDQRFGRWVVEGLQSRQPTIWKCRCDCGTVRGVIATSLIHGDSRSCGCFAVDFSRSQRRKRPFEAVYNSLLRGAKKAKQLVTISYEEFLPFVEVKECHYCGDTVVWKEFLQLGDTVPYNLDRKNNNVGYSTGNCVVCCRRCNFSKADRFTYEEWIEIGKVIRKMRGLGVAA